MIAEDWKGRRTLRDCMRPFSMNQDTLVADAPMLERIARVLCKQRWRDPDELVVGENFAAGQTWLGWHGFISDARDVLIAIRELSPGTLAAFQAEGDNESDFADRWRVLMDLEIAERECKAVEI
jgi:hypothetical protein